jgi:hypothetical protein
MIIKPIEKIKDEINYPYQYNIDCPKCGRKLISISPWDEIVFGDNYCFFCGAKLE